MARRAPGAARPVTADLRRHGVKQLTERHGLPAEAVLCCAPLKQHRPLSYQELAFHLGDSASFRAFARLPWAWSPKKSVLHQAIGAIRPAIWEAINRALSTRPPEPFRQRVLEPSRALMDVVVARQAGDTHPGLGQARRHP